MRENLIDNYEWYIRVYLKLYIPNTFPDIEHVYLNDNEIIYNGFFKNQSTWVGEVTVTLPEVRATYIIALDDYNETLILMDKNWNILETYEDIRPRKSKEPVHYEKLDPNKDADFAILKTLKDFVSKSLSEDQVKDFGKNNIDVEYRDKWVDDSLCVSTVIRIPSMDNFNVSVIIFEHLGILMLSDKRIDERNYCYYYYHIEVLPTGRRLCQLCEITEEDFIALRDQKKKGISPS